MGQAEARPVREGSFSVSHLMPLRTSTVIITYPDYTDEATEAQKV